MNRTEALKELASIEAEQNELEKRAQPLREIVARSDSDGYGVMVLFDADYGWLVETLEDGEWEVENTTAFGGQRISFTEAVARGKELSVERSVALKVYA